MKRLISAVTVGILAIATSNLMAAPITSGITSFTAVTLVDSVGKTVGRFTGGVSSSASVVIVYKNETLAFSIGPYNPLQSSALAWTTNRVLYSQAGCNGTAYINLSYGSPRAVASVKVGNQWMGYVGALGATATNDVTLLSAIDPITGACVNNTLFTGSIVVPVESSFSLDAYGIPPFYIK